MAMEHLEQIMRALGEVSTGAGSLGQSILEMNDGNLEASNLDEVTYVLVRFAALAALDAPVASYTALLDMAAQTDASPEMAAGVLVAIAPVIGGARATSAAEKIQAAFESR